jgi:hypothetical protein
MVGAVPLPGLPVWVEAQNGRHVCTGVSAQISPYGTVLTSTSSLVKVTADSGQKLELPYMAGLTLTAGNRVAIDTASYVVTGVLSADPTSPEDPGSGGPAGQVFTSLLVQAADSGTSNGGGYWQSNVNSDSAAGGAWFYGGGLQSALVGVTEFTAIEVYLPLIYNRFNSPIIRLHGAPTKPGTGLPGYGDSHSVGGASGWVSIPTGWGAFMRDNPAGVGFAPVVGVMASWRGKASDALSGAIRFSGRR